MQSSSIINPINHPEKKIQKQKQQKTHLFTNKVENFPTFQAVSLKYCTCH
jgi:hypothetical protein